MIFEEQKKLKENIGKITDKSTHPLPQGRKLENHPSPSFRTYPSYASYQRKHVIK